ncbi:MAG: hypothetical protein RLZZ127_1515 [Planctomycetota bacterium]|jgi:hypothetical protein
MNLSQCLPCLVCGNKPELIEVGYGRNHYALRCLCGRQTNTDSRPRHAIRDWNAMNGPEHLQSLAANLRSPATALFGAADHAPARTGEESERIASGNPVGRGDGGVP